MAYFLELGDMLEGVLLQSDMSSLGRLACTCKFFKAALADPVFVALLAAAQGFVTAVGSSTRTGAADRAVANDGDRNGPFRVTVLRGAGREGGSSNSTPAAFTAAAYPAALADSIEAVAVMQAVRALASNHVVFHMGSLHMTTAAKARLSEYAALMRRHPRLRMRIDSHTGVGASADDEGGAVNLEFSTAIHGCRP